MRLRNIKGAVDTVTNSPCVVSAPEQLRGSWYSHFGNANPIDLEIGAGKGKFLTTLAGLHPDRNYIGIEKYHSVLIRALEKVEAEPLKNLCFICENALFLETFFAPSEIATIYLNFSDPWPKDRHAKRRLTAREYLERYTGCLRNDGQIIFKTDNRALFDFSLEEVAHSAFRIADVNYDLHHSDACAGNVMTEYEEKFSAMGNPIYRMILERRES